MDITNTLNGFGFAEKTAKISAADFVHETFICFKANKPIDSDNGMRNNIKRIQFFLSKLVFALGSHSVLFICKHHVCFTDN